MSERALLFVMAYGTVMGATWIYVDEFWQIYVEKIGVPLSLFWFVGLYSLLAEALGGFSAPLLQKRLSYRFVFSAILLGVVGAMLALSFSHSLYGLIFLFLVTLGYYLARPIILGFIHDRTASERRAIVDSMQALVFRVGTIAVGLPFGYISTKYSIFTGFSFLGILLLLYAIVYLGFSSRLIDSDSR